MVETNTVVFMVVTVHTSKTTAFEEIWPTEPSCRSTLPALQSDGKNQWFSHSTIEQAKSATLCNFHSTFIGFRLTTVHGHWAASISKMKMLFLVQRPSVCVW